MLSWVWGFFVVPALALAATTDAQFTLSDHSSYVCITDNIGRQCHTEVYCQIDGNGCVNDASRNRYMRRSGFSYPSNLDRCTIHVNSAGKLSSVGSFSTGFGAVLFVRGQQYTHRTGGPSDVYMSAGSSFHWRGVDASYSSQARWTICWSPAVPTAAPSAVPTAPTSAPSMVPTAPSAAPSRTPTLSPSAHPTAPSAAPSPSPTRSPTSPTPSPTRSPTWNPGLPQKFQCDTDTDPGYLHVITGPAWDAAVDSVDLLNLHLGVDGFRLAGLRFHLTGPGGSVRVLNSALGNASFSTVSCGNHRAAQCSDCPQGIGTAGCTGDCRWFNGACSETLGGECTQWYPSTGCTRCYYSWESMANGRWQRVQHCGTRVSVPCPNAGQCMSHDAFSDALRNCNPLDVNRLNLWYQNLPTMAPSSLRPTSSPTSSTPTKSPTSTPTHLPTTSAPTAVPTTYSGSYYRELGAACGPGNNIDCRWSQTGWFSSQSAIEAECTRRNDCVAYSMENGSPWCMKRRYTAGDAYHWGFTDCFIKPTRSPTPPPTPPPTRESSYVDIIPPTSAPVYAVLTYKLSSTIGLTHMSNAELATTKDNFKARFLQANLRISRQHIEYTRLYESTRHQDRLGWRLGDLMVEIGLRPSVTDANPHALRSIMGARITAVAIVANGVTTTVDPEHIEDDDQIEDDDDDDGNSGVAYVIIIFPLASIMYVAVWRTFREKGDRVDRVDRVSPNEDSLQAALPLEVGGPVASAARPPGTYNGIQQPLRYPTHSQPVYPPSLAVPPAPPSEPAGAQPDDALPTLPPPGPPPAYHELFASAPASIAHRQSQI